MPELFEYLFLSSHPYDAICLCSPHWKKLRKFKDYGTYYTRAEMHMLLHTYIVKRSACLPLVQAEGYNRINNGYASRTDPAFIAFLIALVTKKKDGLRPNRNLAAAIHSIPNRGRTVMVSSPKLHKAFKIFTREPMKFNVQKLENHKLTVEENVVVSCEDVKQEGYWTTTWENMSKAEARCVAPDENYKF